MKKKENIRVIWYPIKIEVDQNEKMQDFEPLSINDINNYINKVKPTFYKTLSIAFRYIHNSKLPKADLLDNQFEQSKCKGCSLPIGDIGTPFRWNSKIGRFHEDCWQNYLHMIQN